MPSRFNVTCDFDHRQKVVFNTSSAAVVKVDANTWRSFLAPGTKCVSVKPSAFKTLRLLRSKGLMVPLGVDELDLVRLRFLAGRHADSGVYLYVTPTLACNLRCSYCFEGLAQSLSTQRSMDRRVVNKVVRYIALQARGKRRVGITWFGGEPLLALQTIEQISRLLVPAFAKIGINYSASVITNGVLVDRKAVAVLKAGRVESAQVTVDVPNTERRDRQGMDTTDRALDGTALLASVMNVTLRVNMPRDDAPAFDAFYEKLLHRGLHKRIRAIDFARVMETECARKPCANLLDHRRFVRILERERNKAEELGLPLPPLLPESPGACMAVTCSSAVIGPDGSLYKCPEDVGLAGRAYGSVFDTELTLSNLLPWITYDWFQYKECRNCPVLPQCAGGCPHQRMFRSGDSKRNDFCFRFTQGDLKSRIRNFVTRNRGQHS